MTTAPASHGAAIKALRKAYGWRQNKLAAAVGVSDAYLCNIEANRKPGSPEVLRKIADTLGVPLAAITTGRHISDVA
jgi:transcriptional regulator with XRE-family HTH domain